MTNNYISYGRIGRNFRVRVAARPESMNELSRQLAETTVTTFRQALTIARNYATYYEVTDFDAQEMRRYFGVK